MPSRWISPRVALYDLGEDPPAVPANGIALAQVKGRAFGDGSHPTTRLCAGAVDLLARQKPGLSVLDVGTGTGVLARIARMRGASFVAATEIDPEALASAQSNSALDHHPLAIEFTNSMPDAWGGRFDLAVANILEGPLTELAPSLARSLNPGSFLLLSGFTPLQVHFLRAVFENHGLSQGQESHLDGWALLTLRWQSN